MNKKGMLKAASYLAAPKLTYMARNPKKTAIFKAGTWAAERMLPQRRRPSRGAMALKGLGAAAVALPVGMWLGSRFLGRTHTPTSG